MKLGFPNVSAGKESTQQRSLVGYSPKGCRKSDTTEQQNSHTHTHTHMHV